MKSQESMGQVDLCCLYEWVIVINYLEVGHDRKQDTNPVA